MRSASSLLKQAWSAHPPKVISVTSLPFTNKRAWSSFQDDIGAGQIQELSTPRPLNGVSGKPDDLVYPDPPNTTHNDLKSFLEHAERIGLDKNTTGFVGTHFEYISMVALQRFGFQLKRVGASSDCGIDLLGTWRIPSTHFPITVLVQCKAIKQPRPNLIRELEGSFAAAPAGWRSTYNLGVLVTERPATKGMREAMGRSRWPMVCIACTKNGKVEQIVWNKQAEEKGLGGMGVATWHTGDGEQQVVLTFKGRHLMDDTADLKSNDPAT